MRILIVAALMGTVTGLWLQRSGTNLSEAELGKIRGNQAYFVGIRIHISAAAPFVNRSGI